MAPIGGFLESVFELRYEINGSKGKGQKEKSGLSNGDERYRIVYLRSEVLLPGWGALALRILPLWNPS
jgi:hypothetical protein